MRVEDIQNLIGIALVAVGLMLFTVLTQILDVLQ